MVIGNGLIAKVFKNFQLDNRVIVVASGVSNSRNTDKKEFDREYNLVKNLISDYPDKLLVYFSSCSINNEISPYTEHKLFIEKLIVNNSNNYLIMRLPLVLGRNQSYNQLAGYLFSRLHTNKEIEIYNLANRFFVDSEDLPIILEHFLFLELKNEILDIAFDNSITIIELVNIIEKLLKKEFSKKIILDRASPYVVKNKRFIKLISTLDISVFNQSVEKMIIKYLVYEKN